MKANAYELLGCIKRWLNRAPNVIRKNIPPFTPTGDINDAIFIIHQDEQYQHVYESMDHSPPKKYFSEIPYDGWNLSNEKSHEYFQKFLQSTKPIRDNFTMIEKNDSVRDTISRQMNKEEAAVLDEQRSPEEMRQIEELDNPNRIWKPKRNEFFQTFMQEKLRNILQWKEFCEKNP